MTDIALVTGAAGALGSEVAKTLAARGYRLALCDIVRAQTRLGDVARELGNGAMAITGAFASRAEWVATEERVRESFGGPVTHAVLVAGGWRGGKPFHESEDSVWEAMFTQNVEATRLALAAILPGMVAAKKGSVVIVGSRASVRPWDSKNAAAYAAAKAAVTALTQTVAEELVESGVRVNAVLPSTMDTAANRAAMPDADPSKWVSTGSVAEVIGFLLSNAARDVSGALLPVYGRS